jgi:hypothetical protein
MIPATPRTFSLIHGIAYTTKRARALAFHSFAIVALNASSSQPMNGIVITFARNAK